MYFITTKRMLEVCFSAHPNIQYRTKNSDKMHHKKEIVGDSLSKGFSPFPLHSTIKV